MGNDYFLEVKNLSKTFPGVKALKNVGLRVRKGSVHALVGANGAGKSTLVKILYGLLEQDKKESLIGSNSFLQKITGLLYREEGEIILDGEPFHPKSPADAIQSGISMIGQELSVPPYLTIAQNIFLGREKRNKISLVDHKKIDQETSQLLSSLHINLDPHLIMENLSIAQIQLVEIAKAISCGTKLVIMDEPTSALSEKEVNQLFIIINDLKERGVAVIYITQKLDELFLITDEMSIYRDGEFIGSKKTQNITKGTLVSMMVGRSWEHFFQKEQADIGEVVLKVENFSCAGKFQDINFSIRRGEILGFTGLVGSGRTELMETIFACRPKKSGKLYLEGQEIEVNSPKDAIDNKIGFLTEDRHKTGIYPHHFVKENISIVNLPHLLRNFFVDSKKERKLSENQIQKLNIKIPNAQKPAMFLSGGNQQKVLISRWLSDDSKILIFDEPTKGIDVSTKSEIYAIMSTLAKEGKSIILVSSEIPEILAISDRIIIMRQGSIVAEFPTAQTNLGKILQIMSR